MTLSRQFEDAGGVVAGDLAAEVDVLRDGRSGVAELVGDLPGAEAGVIEPGCHRLAERVRRDPVIARAIERAAQGRCCVIRP